MVDNCLNLVMGLGDFSYEELFYLYKLRTVANRMGRKVCELTSITRVMTDKLN